MGWIIYNPCERKRKFVASLVSQSHSFGDTSSGFCRLNGRLIFRSATNENLHMSTLSGSGGGRNKQNPFVINATQTVRGPPEVFKCDKWEV